MAANLVRLRPEDVVSYSGKNNNTTKRNLVKLAPEDVVSAEIDPTSALKYEMDSIPNALKYEKKYKNSSLEELQASLNNLNMEQFGLEQYGGTFQKNDEISWLKLKSAALAQEAVQKAKTSPDRFASKYAEHSFDAMQQAIVELQDLQGYELTHGGVTPETRDELLWLQNNLYTKNYNNARDYEAALKDAKAKAEDLGAKAYNYVQGKANGWYADGNTPESYEQQLKVLQDQIKNNLEPGLQAVEYKAEVDKITGAQYGTLPQLYHLMYMIPNAEEYERKYKTFTYDDIQETIADLNLEKYGAENSGDTFTKADELKWLELKSYEIMRTGEAAKRQEQVMLAEKKEYEDTKNAYTFTERAMNLLIDDPTDWAKASYDDAMLEYRKMLDLMRQIDPIHAERYEEKLDETGNVFQAIWDSIETGAATFNLRLLKSANMFLDTINLSDGKFGKYITNLRKQQDTYVEYSNEKTAYAWKATGTDSQVWNQGIQALTMMIPDMTLMLMEAFSAVGTVGATAPIAAQHVAGTAQMITSAIKSIGTNPFFYTSMLQTVGQEYYDALDSGATETEAFIASTLSSLLQSVVEVGGTTGNAGLQSLPDALKAAKGKGAGKVALEWVKSSFSEGKEEVVQSVLSKLTAAAVYDQNRKIFSLEDEDAIINPKLLAQEFGMGTAVAAIAGGGQVTFQQILQHADAKQLQSLGKAVLQDGDVAGLANYAKDSMNPEIRAIAVGADSGKVSAADAGTLYKYVYQDISAQLDGAQSYEAVSETYKDILRKNPDPAVAQIASSLYIEKTMDALQIAEEEAMQQVQGVEQSVLPQAVDNAVQSGYTDGTGGGQNGGEELLYNRGGQAGEQNADTQGRVGAVQEAAGGMESDLSTRGVETGVLGDRGDSGRVTVSAEQIERLKTTAVKNADGTPKPVYHFTGNMEFDTFAEGDTGFHFGSEAQAAQRGQDLNQSGRMIEAYLDIQNPVRIDMDIMNWQPGALALKLYGDGIISENEMYNIGRLVQESGVGYNSPAAVELRRILAEKGYDGVVYQNGFEGEGESYIAFYPEQIITLDDGRGGTGNAVRTARRSGGADIVSEERVGQARGDTQYTEAQYNDFGWARANGVLSDTAFRLLTEKIAEIKTGTQFARTRYGDYIIPVGDESGIYNILVYTDGNMESPHIRKIIEINVEDRQKLNEIRSYIYAAEKSNEAGGYRNAYEYAKRVYGEENIVAYTRQDYPAFRQYAGEGQRGAGRAGDRADGTGIDRGTDATGAGAGRQVNRRTQADSDGSAFSMQNDTAQERTQRDQYAKEDRFWQAENRNAPEVSNDKATAKIQRAIRGLFGGGNNREADSIGDIVDMIRDTFGVPISTGKFRQRAFGIYKRRAEAIRTKVTNALPTIAHELGHHLDKRYGLHRLRSMSEALRVLRESRPEFYNSYSESERPGEAVAEFVRDYLTDRLMAKEKYPTFFADFERTLSENGPEDFKNLKKIGDEINRYFAMGKKERARAAVLTYAEYGRKKKKNLGFEQMSDAVQRHFFDSAYALKKLSPEAYRRFYYAVKSSVRAVNALEGEYVAGLDGNPMKAYDADGNVRTDKDGNALLLPSFRNVLAPIEAGEMYNDFNLYLVCRHGLSWLETGKRVFADDSINNEKFMRDTVKELEAQYPEFKKTANDVNDWWQSVLWEYGVKSGLMTKQQVQDLHQKYPHYVPLMRAVDTQGKGMKRGVANQRAPIVRAKGSGTEIVDPVANIGIKLEQLMRAADRNAVMQSLAGLADTQDGFGALMEEVPPDLVPVTVRTAAIRDDLKNMGQEMGFSALDPQGFSDFIDQVIGDTITEFKTVIGGKDRNVIWVYENGKRRLYQVHDAGLLEAITDLNVTRDPAFLRAIGNVTRKFKALTTGGNPVWSLASNAPRDFSSGYVYGSERNVFKYTRDYIKAVLHVLKRSKELQLYKTAGGGYNNSLTMSDKQVLSTMRRILMRDGSAKERIKNFFNLAEKIEKISDAVETAPRLAEFERVLRRTGDTHAALYAADEATVNFNRGGITAKQLDKFTPYLNASLQGLNKFLQHAGTNKNDFWLKFTVVEIVKTGIALGLGYFFANSLDDLFDEYDKLSAYKRNNFYNIYMGDGKFFSIPKAKDTAVFGTMVDNIARLWRQGKDADIKQETRDFADYMWLCFGPPIVLKDSIIVSTYAELAANKDFKGTPIVPEYYIDNYVDEEQYNERTTWIAKAIGQITGLSPMRIDYIINSNFGYLGTINKALGIDDKDWTLGIKSKYVTDNAYSTDIINRFYDHADDYEKKAKSYPDNAEYVYKYKQYNAVKSIVSDLNAYGRDDPDMARQCKILARDYVDDFEKNGTVNKQLLALLEDSGDSEILFDKSFSRTYSRNKVEYTMDIQDYLDYVDTYYEEVEMEYEDILSMGLSDEATIRMLKDAKKTITKRLDQQYKTVK